MSDRERLAQVWRLLAGFGLGRINEFPSTTCSLRQYESGPTWYDFILELARGYWISFECIGNDFESVTANPAPPDATDVLVILNDFLCRTCRIARVADIALTVYLRFLWRGDWCALTAVVEMERGANRHASHYDDPVLMEMAVDAVIGVSVSMPPILDYLLDHDPRVSRNLGI